MPPNASKELESISLRGENKTAVIIGATTGIGAAVARLYAKLGCSRVIVFGRNEARGEEVCESMRGIAPEKSELKVEFVKGDVSYVKGMKAAAEGIESAVGLKGIDYFVMCQNGPPTGIITPNADGEGVEFAIQTLSRFALTYLLTTHNTLAPNAVVMSICNTGQNLDGLDVKDLSLKGKRFQGKYKASLALDQSKRDSTVLDAFFEEFNTRYPQYRYFNVFPGLVRSELFTLDAFPIPLRWVVSLGLKTMGVAPADYANVPVYIAVSPDAPKQLGPGKFFDHKLMPKVPGAWAKNPKNRTELWEKLKEMIGET